MKSILKHLKIFTVIYSARLGKDFSLPLFNQVFQNIGSLCFFFVHLMAFKLIVDKFSFPGWSKPEMWTMLFTFEIFTYTSFFLFWKGLNYTVRDINSGAFDLIISKPVSSQLITFFRGGGLHNLTASVLGLLFLMVFVFINHINISVFSVVLYFFILALSLWTAYCIAISFISLNFKYGRLDATVGAIFQVQEVYKYPSTIYSGLQVLFWFLVVSLSLFTTLPAVTLLLKPVDFSLVVVFITTFFTATIISQLLWRYSLRHYSSASS